MDAIGSVSRDVIRLRERGGRMVEIPPQHVAAVSFRHERQRIVGIILTGIGALAIIGGIWIAIADSVLEGGQLLIGAGALAVGVLLYLGRFRITLAGTDGKERSVSVAYWNRADAERYVASVRALLFGQ